MACLHLNREALVFYPMRTKFAPATKNGAAAIEIIKYTFNGLLFIQQGSFIYCNMWKEKVDRFFVISHRRQ